MNLKLRSKLSADNIGMASSTLCLIHCMITPFIFIAQACTVSCCATAPVWWRAIDFLFLAISFIAVYFSAKTTSKQWMKIGFYALFVVLTVLILNEYVAMFQANKIPMYIAAGLLASMHFYNRRCSKCDNACCSLHEGKNEHTFTLPAQFGDKL